MPRHDWRDDELMSRERGNLGYDRDRGYRGFDDRDRGAFFDRDREEPSSRRRRTGGWGSLLADESSGGRSRREYRGEQHFGPDDERPGIPRDETERLIASNKVEGTPVYDRNGDRLGSVHNFMVDKFRGRVVYAVLKSGSGFLGLDDRYYPIDWDQLTFDTRLGGYRVNIVEEDLQRSGSWDRNERWSERSPMRGERGRLERDRDRYPERGRMRDRDEDRGMMREPW
jgi:sporulation protein YlmC with PRC-barrel domain